MEQIMGKKTMGKIMVEKMKMRTKMKTRAANDEQELTANLNLLKCWHTSAIRHVAGRHVEY